MSRFISSSRRLLPIYPASDLLRPQCHSLHLRLTHWSTFVYFAFQALVPACHLCLTVDPSSWHFRLIHSTTVSFASRAVSFKFKLNVICVSLIICSSLTRSICVSALSHLRFARTLYCVIYVSYWRPYGIGMNPIPGRLARRSTAGTLALDAQTYGAYGDTATGPGGGLCVDAQQAEAVV